MCDGFPILIRISLAITALLMHLSVFLKRSIFFFNEERPYHSPCRVRHFHCQLESLSLSG